MKTRELIAALAQDRLATPAPARLLARVLPLALLVALAVVLVTLRARADLPQVAGSPRFLFKFVVTLSLAIPALVLAARLATPLPRPGGWLRAIGLAPLVLLAGALVEMSVLPAGTRVAAAVGENSLWCLTMVPLIATAPLAAMLYCLRQSAPANPALAGAVAGLASGAMAAMLYALHCTDDSPLFVALWYTPGVLLVSAIGATLAARVARW